MRKFSILALAFIVSVFFINPLLAGNAQSNANASAKAWATGGVSSASGGSSSSDDLSIAIPGAPSPAVDNTHECMVSDSWAIPIYSQSTSTFGLACMLMAHREDVCQSAHFLAAEARRTRDVHAKTKLMAAFTDARQMCVDLHIRVVHLKDEELLSSVAYAGTMVTAATDEPPE